MRSLVSLLSCLVAGVFACAGSTTGPSTIGNSTGAKGTRESLIKDVAAATTAGDTQRLLALADARGIMSRALDCPAAAMVEIDEREAKLKGRATELVRSTKGAQITLLEVDNDLRGWGASHRHHGGNALLVTKGGKVETCVAKTDLLFHEARAKVRVATNGTSHDMHWKLDLVLVDGQWYLADVPRGPGGSSSDAFTQFSEFTDMMCACKDKACADKINDNMTKWAQEMAKSADEKPDDMDPDLAKKFADVGTKYGECMTKLMTTQTP